MQMLRSTHIIYRQEVGKRQKNRSSMNKLASEVVLQQLEVLTISRIDTENTNNFSLSFMQYMDRFGQKLQMRTFFRAST